MFLRGLHEHFTFNEEWEKLTLVRWKSLLNSLQQNSFGDSFLILVVLQPLDSNEIIADYTGNSFNVNMAVSPASLITMPSKHSSKRFIVASSHLI